MSEPSPLSATDPDSLTLLFTTDPLLLSDSQLTIAVGELRRRRNAFLSDEAAKSLKEKTRRDKAAPQPAAAAAAADKPVGEISLEDL